MKIRRNDIIKIATSKYKLLGEPPIEKIDYDKWVNFIEAHKDYFVWYEDTLEGIDTKQNIDKVPENFKDRVLHTLNKIRVYGSNKIVKRPYDFIITYSTSDGMITISIEKKMVKEIAEILLEMAEYLEGKLIINGTKILNNIEQLE
jgi:hypothetical protein